jgi:osmotically-inducible protein OsmY
VTRTPRARKIEQAIARDAGLDVIVEEDAGTLRMEGQVDSVEDSLASEDIATSLAHGEPIDNDLDVEAVIPTGAEGFAGGDAQAELVWAEPEPDATSARLELDADFTDQVMLDDAGAAAGPRGAQDDDPAADAGEAVWTPPSDPVIEIDEYGAARVLGGFAADAFDDVAVERSAEDRRPGDEALADTVRHALRADAATADLRVRVSVHDGVVHLHGHVPGPEDADSAEEVAARVPGVQEVREELDIAAI